MFVQVYGPCKNWLRRAASAASLTDWLIAALTLAIVYLAWSGGKQTNDLITAAQKNAQAATNFSKSADSINNEIRSAVQNFKDMTAANQESAKAATTSSNIAKSALEVSERAFVGVTSLTMDKDFAEGQGTKITAVIVNSGKTPAFNVRVRHYFAYAPKPISKNLRFTPMATVSTTFLLPLVQLVQASDKVPAPPKEVRELIRRGTIAFVAYGIIEYTDVFKKKRVTKYCYLYDPALPLFFQVCANGNEAN